RGHAMDKTSCWDLLEEFVSERVRRDTPGGYLDRHFSTFKVRVLNSLATFCACCQEVDSIRETRLPQPGSGVNTYRIETESKKTGPAGRSTWMLPSFGRSRA